jgi:hypothetical protein
MLLPVFAANQSRAKANDLNPQVFDIGLSCLRHGSFIVCAR